MRQSAADVTLNSDVLFVRSVPFCDGLERAPVAILINPMNRKCHVTFGRRAGRSRDTFAAPDWLGGPVACAVVRRKLKRSIAERAGDPQHRA